LQCWITNPKVYLRQQIFTEYFFLWLGAVFFIITAICFAFTRYGLRLGFGFFWFGFIKRDRLFRLGLASFDSQNVGDPKFSISLRCNTTLGVVDLIPVQYFDKYHTTTAVSDDLGQWANGADLEVGYIEGATPTYPIREQCIPNPSALN
jgi:hypothetical protein